MSQDSFDEQVQDAVASAAEHFGGSESDIVEQVTPAVVDSSIDDPEESAGSDDDDSLNDLIEADDQ